MHDRAAPDATRLPNRLTAGGLEMAGQQYLRQLLRAARAGDPELAEDTAAVASAAEQILVLHAQGAA